MNHAKTLTAIALASLLTVSLPASAANQSEYNKAAASAKAAISKAKAAKFEWRDSGKILKAADKAAKAGDYKKAVKLATKARHQGELALAQSKTQAGAGPH